MHKQSFEPFSMASSRMYAGSKRLLTPMRRISLLCYLCLLLTAICTACSPWPAGQTTTGKLSIQGLPQARTTYVALGASDTYGIGTADPSTQNWAADLTTKLGLGIHLVNLGVPDISTHAALTAELPVALDAHPDLITIWLAVNDLATQVPVASYSQDLEQLLSRLQSAFPHARIAVANVPDLTLLPYFESQLSQQIVSQGGTVTPGASAPGTTGIQIEGTPHPGSFNTLNALYEYAQQRLQDQVTAYNNSIASIVVRHHLLLVDLYQQWSTLKSHPEYISKDGLHPTAAGYAQIADLFYQALQKSSS